MGRCYAFINARPSFIEGFARVLDLGGTLTEYNQSLNGEQADSIALTMDWCAIGEDFREAMKVLAPQTGIQVQDAKLQKSPE